MRASRWNRLGLAGIVLLIVLAAAPSALAASAVDQYSEGIPTAGGQKPTRDLGSGQAGTPTTIPPQTQATLQRTERGAAADKAAKLTAPSRPSAGSSDTSDSNGLGLLLPLILAATLIAAVAIFVVRRRPGPTPG